MKRQWNLIACALAALLSISITAMPTVAAESGDGIQWLSYEEGRHRGASENKKVFVVFNADWCRYCLKMDKETFRDPTVVAYVNRNFIPVSVNSDKEQDIAAQYNIRGLPSMWFLSETGDRIVNLPGYFAADEMLNRLKYIGSDSYLSMSYKAFVEKKAN